MMTKEKLKRIVVFYLVLNLLFEVVSPTAAYALTSGPAQPEMGSFEPVGTTEMVDVFSGDFNYNIPLMTVPGPNGGYPLNLAYHAGIGMEDEASWVGLGWNINPGVISRQMRGLPDDFNGASITKEVNMNPNRTASLSFGFPFASPPEFWGLQYNQSMNLGLTWNSYQGIGFTGGYSGSFMAAKNTSVRPSFGADLSYNSLAGETNLTSNFSLTSRNGDANNTSTLAYTMNSLNGLKDAHFSMSKNRHRQGLRYFEDIDYHTSYQGSASSMPASVSFASSSFVPHTEMSQSGYNVGASFKFGPDAGGVFENLQISASYSQTKYKDTHRDFSGYGYLYSGERTNSTNWNNPYCLMDFNREHDVVPSKDIPSMPAPISTYDLYLVKGQGIGGIFRPYRTDVGLLFDPGIEGNNYGGNLGVEFGAGDPFQIGVNISLDYSKSYTGRWRNDDLYKDIKDHAYQGGFYFKSASEIVANEHDDDDVAMNGDKYPIVQRMDFNPVSLSPSQMADNLSPFVEFETKNNNIITRDHSLSRRTRSQLMSYKTFSEINSMSYYESAWSDPCVYGLNANPLTTAPVTYALPGSSNSTIAEMSVVNPDGNRYIYALPALNNTEKEVSFSIQYNNNTSTRHTYESDKIIDYSGGTDNNKDNNAQLEDHYFSSTTIPSYVHSYMLTAIVSPDYVDLTGNGPSADDFGYWVKFNYTRTSSAFQWRAPFLGANFIKGALSTDLDDKAAYTYGTKEIWYLNSIETKTHLALFHLSGRDDGYGASAEDQMYGASGPATHIDEANQLMKLDKISLYAKASPGTPLKEVNLGYSYDLCHGAWNSKVTTANPNKGKLTLKTVSFSYLGNDKGSLSPYVFDYHESASIYNGTTLSDHPENPDYSILQEDRWGNYKENTFGVDNTLFPYTPQSSFYNNDDNADDEDTYYRNAHASAWSLKQITLPSGGKIKVSYEADDYAYVHDQAPMEMVRVLGFAPSISTAYSSISPQMNSANEYLFFEVNDLGVTSASFKNYFSNMDEVYFKIYTDLKKNGINGVPKKDYVEGYAKIDATSCGLLSGTQPAGGSFHPARNIKVGYIKVNKVSIHDVGGLPYTHPFRKAAWQYLKLERKDVLFPGTSSNNSNSSNVTVQYLTQLANSVIGAFTSATQLFIGYYSYCQAAGYGAEMSYDKPSFIRLRTPDGVKYGGGHRVSSVRITDTWQGTYDATNNPTGENESTYGQEYSYRMPDGTTSSGVACYEPLLGGEEIPYRKPIRYSSPYFIFKNKNLYMEEPIGESFYPGASVGYRRVVVKNIGQKEHAAPYHDITKTREGITVYEFYTTKDFPYSITRSDLTHGKFNPKIPIPFIGSVNFENHGFSQWMNVVTNDMHGKPRSMATYAADADVNNPNTQPVSKTEYIYSTVANYDPDGTNRLNNTVTALFNDAEYRQVNMGTTTENYIDMREHSGVSMNQGMQTNVSWEYPPIVIVPVFMPSIDYAETMFKSVVHMQVTSQCGILSETRNTTEGSMVTSKNLMFDAYTGKPLLTTVTNDFDKPIYNYSYSAQWAYPRMGNAYKNDRLEFDFTVSSSGASISTSGVSVSDLNKGDELFISGQRCWVKKTDPVGGFAKIVMEDGSDFGVAGPTYHALVARSGKTNQQVVSNGAIVSLSDPVNSRTFKLFDAYNLAAKPASSISAGDCGSSTVNTYAVSYSANVLLFTKGSVDKSTCAVKIVFPSTVSASSIYSASNYQLKRAGKKVYVINTTTGATDYTGDLTDECGLSECMDGVLNATASVFNDSIWRYDYGDVGDPSVTYHYPTTTSHVISSLSGTTVNPYMIGIRGIWRMEKSYAYQTLRKQEPYGTGGDYTHTKIQTDGTFNDFAPFDWSLSPNYQASPATPVLRNQKWTMANQVTKYSPYGFEVENKNAIGIYTSALYGYSNSVQTAITANATYYETGYDGFEDYTGTAYPASLAHGHIQLSTSGGGSTLSFANMPHTGKKSIALTSGQVLNMSMANYPNLSSTTDPYQTSTYYIQTIPGKKYTWSGWVKVSAGVVPSINITGATSTEVLSDGIKIEGWQKIEANFVAGTSSVGLSLSFTGLGSQTAYVDDIRLQPFKSTMKTFVYDPANLWLVAELDNQNYATFYNYDEEGTLTQVKKETVKGVQTLKTTRSNIAIQHP